MTADLRFLLSASFSGEISHTSTGERETSVYQTDFDTNEYFEEGYKAQIIRYT